MGYSKVTTRNQTLFGRNLILLIFCIFVAACASTPMKTVPGMTLRAVDSEAALSVLGGIRFHSKHPEIANVEIWETMSQQISRHYGVKPDPNGVGFFYFRNGILIDRAEIDREVAAEASKKKEIAERARRERQIKQQQDQERENQRLALQRQENEERDRRYQQEKENAERQRELCLGSSSVGICQSASQNNLQFMCNQNIFSQLKNLFNEYCYVIDEFNIKTRMEVRNNTNLRIKDLMFSCSQIAKSGTVLRQNKSTIYDIWNPGESKIISLSFLKHDQVDSMNCKVESWK
jgi:hypothetical protein